MVDRKLGRKAETMSETALLAGQAAIEPTKGGEVSPTLAVPKISTAPCKVSLVVSGDSGLEHPAKPISAAATITTYALFIANLLYSVIVVR
jgi:hypothetical protein